MRFFSRKKLESCLFPIYLCSSYAFPSMISKYIFIN